MNVKYVDDITNVNSNNHHEYNPFFYDQQKRSIVMDRKWWTTLPNFIQNDIIKRVGSIDFVDNINTPHNLYTRHEEESKIYLAHLEGYDYKYWSSCVRDKIEINIDETNKKILLEISNKRIITGNRLSESDLDDLENLKQKIDKNIDSNVEYFCKLGSQSAKHDFRLYPLKGSINILDYLTKSKKFIDREYALTDKESYIILNVWNHDINPRNEFRLFVHNKKLTGISQQKWYQNNNYTNDEINAIIASLSNEHFNELINSVTNIYDDVVLDVWIDFNKQLCHLIECNVFGIFSAAGASLFNWISDHDILYGDRPELRVIR